MPLIRSFRRWRRHPFAWVAFLVLLAVTIAGRDGRILGPRSARDQAAAVRTRRSSGELTQSATTHNARHERAPILGAFPRVCPECVRLVSRNQPIFGRI